MSAICVGCGRLVPLDGDRVIVCLACTPAFNSDRCGLCGVSIADGEGMIMVRDGVSLLTCDDCFSANDDQDF
jgi:hypothetical protein